jgi:integrase
VILTHSSIQALQPPASGQMGYADTKIPGLQLRVSQGGAKTWVIRYRANGRRPYLTLGRFPDMGLADARIAARSYLGEVAGGKDPAQERNAAKAEPTFSDLAQLYLERHAVKTRRRTQQGTIGILRNDLLPAWADRKLSSIRRADIHDVLDRIMDRGAPAQANQVKATISTIFRFAEDRSLIEYNPAVRLRAPAPKPSRDRVLSEDELFRLFQVLKDEPARYQAVVRTALLTAARRGEIIRLPWSEIDGDWWILPATRAKNNCEHRIPLVPSVRAAIEGLERDGPFVFHGGYSRKPTGEGAVTGVSKWFPPLLARAGIEGATFHDLRRTAAIHMNSIGIAAELVERVLNHAQRGVAAVYNRHSYDVEKRSALTRWEHRLNAIIEGGRQSSKVIALRG